MDVLLSKASPLPATACQFSPANPVQVTQQAMNYAIRTGITITSGYAIRQCGRLAFPGRSLFLVRSYPMYVAASEICQGGISV